MHSLTDEVINIGKFETRDVPPVGAVMRDNDSGQNYVMNHLYIDQDAAHEGTDHAHVTLSMILCGTTEAERRIPLNIWLDYQNNYAYPVFEVVGEAKEEDDIPYITVHEHFPEVGDLWYDEDYDTYLVIMDFVEAKGDPMLSKFTVESVHANAYAEYTMELREWYQRSNSLFFIPEDEIN